MNKLRKFEFLSLVKFNLKKNLLDFLYLIILIIFKGVSSETRR